jgi:DNA-binding beta-propeller fold protein YncE
MSESPAIVTPAAESPEPAEDTEDAAETTPRRRRRRKAFLLLLLLLAFIGLLALALWYVLFRQPIPLPSIPGETVMPTYSTSVYGARRSLGVAVNAAGDRIYVGETEGDRIARVFDGSGNLLGLMEPPVSTGADHVPVYLAVDPINGEVYVTDRPTGSVYIYDANGTYQRAFEPEGLEGWQPLAIAFDTAGNLYVSDVSVNPQTVLVFDRNGSQTRTLGETAGLNFPNGIAVDAAGNVYVTDGNNGRLVVIDTSGAVIAQVGRGTSQGNLGLPRGIAIDGQGRVHVGDATGQGVFVYAVLKPGERRLDYLGFFGGQGVSNGAFQFPNGVAVDGRGRVYITDSGNHRVQVWTY